MRPRRVAGLGDDLVSRLGLEQQPQPAAHDRMIVREHERDPPCLVADLSHRHVMSTIIAQRYEFRHPGVMGGHRGLASVVLR